jgi:sporulation integral membrane protein YtvI
MILAFQLSDLITVPFGWLLGQLYQLTNNYGIAMIIFAVLVKIILLPITAKSKKSSMKMSRMAPRQKAIQEKYANDPQKQNEAMQALYKEEGVSMGGGCLWSMIPLFILIPLFTVIRQPIVYMLGEDLEVAEKIVSVIKELAAEGVFSKNNYYDQVIAAKYIPQFLPQLEQAATGGLSALSAWALDLAGRLPGNMGDLVSRSVTDFFSGGSRLLEQGFRYALSLTGGILSRVPNGALIFGTALISGYMISARLPGIRAWFRKKLTLQRPQKILEGLCRIKTALLGWLKAQLKLMGITWAILTLGLVLLRIPYAPVWAAAVALVDAFPILGTGTILLPWALVSFLQADTARAVGLLGTYALISLTRSVLEPKLLGSQMGLDPLVTLISLYSGYRLWGFGGMILAPVLAVAAVQLLREPSG